MESGGQMNSSTWTGISPAYSLQPHLARLVVPYCTLPDLFLARSVLASKGAGVLPVLLGFGALGLERPLLEPFCPLSSVGGTVLAPASSPGSATVWWAVLLAEAF